MPMSIIKLSNALQNHESQSYTEVSLSHTTRFLQLSRLLKEFEIMWRDSVFQQPSPQWAEHYPELHEQLLALNDEALNKLETSASELHEFISERLPGYSELLGAIQLPRQNQTLNPPKFADVGIPGRKWQQITAFLSPFLQGHPSEEKQLTGHPSEELPPLNSELVDWCAGKSHLGRTAALITGNKLNAIEHDETLCRDGKLLADKMGVQANFDCADVLHRGFTFNNNQQVLALHACGDLHRKLLKEWKHSNSSKLILAPCCYEKWLKGAYKPLSQLAKDNNLHLSTDQVKLAMQETVTASMREQALMHKLQTVRLAFDILQRDIRGIDEYLPTPSLPLSAANLSVTEIFSFLANKKGLKLPELINTRDYTDKAQIRYHQLRRLQLAAQGFRRPLELWLVSDLALYLEEEMSNDIQVTLLEFCSRTLSPRNIQLTATRF